MTGSPSISRNQELVRFPVYRSGSPSKRARVDSENDEEQDYPQMESTRLQEQMQILLQRMAQLEATNQDLTSRLPPASSGIEHPRTPIQLPEPIPTIAPSRRPILPDPERFDGSNAKVYNSFERDIRMKMAADGDIFKVDAVRVAYVMGRLTGPAKQRAEAWLSAQERSGHQYITYTDLLDSMRLVYHDTESERRALDKLALFRQMNQPIGSFLANFDILLTEAGGAAWNDVIKINFLKRALKHEIRTGLIGVEEPDNYTKFCSIIRRIDNQLWNLKQDTPARPKYWQSRQPVVASSPDPDVMDWERTIASMDASDRKSMIAAMQRFQKTTMSSTEQVRHRQEGLCFSCHQPGHLSRNCPKKGSKAATPRVAAVTGLIKPAENEQPLS